MLIGPALGCGLLRVVEHPTSQEDIHLTTGEVVLDPELRPLGQILDDELLAPSNLLRNPLDPKLIPLADGIVLLLIDEDQGKDPEIDQVGPVNAGERLDDGPFEAEVHRCKGSVLPARALAIVASADHEASALLPRSLGKVRIDPAEGILGDGRDVAA